MRQAGCLIPLFSIRSASGWGLGEIPDIVPFARWAARAGFSVVQLLPTHEASRGQSSPYAALSAFALDPVYAGVDALPDFAAAGGRDALTPAEQEELAALRAVPAVPWPRVRALKARALDLAFRSFLEVEWRRRTPRAAELEAFQREHAGWLEPYALFVALHDDRFGGRPWMAWDAPLRDRAEGALSAARAELSERVLYHGWLQWQLDLQWHAARREANAAGVELMGDLPFMVATDSADVWSRPFDFDLDARVGVPPDAFSDTGQDWGLPVYRWEAMAEHGHAWMTARARRSAELYGLYRVDHVVGLYRTYYRPNDGGPAAFTPAAEPEQTANGERMLAIFAEGARVIAEDLGTVPDFVRASLTRCGVPGYRILRWEREWKQPGQPFKDPAAWPALSVGTTGTHDTDALADWYDGMGEAERRALLALPALGPLRARGPHRFDTQVRDLLLDVVYGSGSDLLLLPFQDAFGARERVNVPGTVTDANWSYRMPLEVTALAADRAATERLRRLAARSRRLGG
ncbi:4-alpha-glucanotransferase [Anaeromyxobacter diazotrophicus]|uniref:4-alpha-glucanotransferase n=1 Tax=Anaeromyxobacter diazotrophicus TaxID=2590199 RepID=A0A7I9VJW0_9BACT|nr:4-alpha-glucanotransferase [Anaeromyxobacter diazotrophicus]GEJ56440.1 4-alpha-glucanotransferase [Anaeromyxobacter diazotrophicus]